MPTPEPPSPSIVCDSALTSGAIDVLITIITAITASINLANPWFLIPLNKERQALKGLAFCITTEELLVGLFGAGAVIPLLFKHNRHCLPRC